MEPDAALDELLEDLRHDLGKYLLLPLRMLPADAGPAAVRGALGQALLHTRKRGSHSQSAEALWKERRPALSALGAGPRFAALETAVMRALRWRAALTGEQPIDRSELERDLAGVDAAIDAWWQELRRG